MDTLLGPEETGPDTLTDRASAWFCGGVGSDLLDVLPGLPDAFRCAGVDGGGWLLFENCTVDASISLTEKRRCLSLFAGWGFCCLLVFAVSDRFVCSSF